MAGRAWTTREIRYLLDNAGRVPEADICAELGRTPRAVESMAHRLRLGGFRLELRSYAPRVARCPECGGPMDALRGQRFRPGSRPEPPARPPETCAACELRGKARRERERAEAAVKRLPMDSRRHIEAARKNIGNINIKRPEPPAAPYIDPGAPWPRRKRAEERHQMESERAAAADAFRELRAAQRRRERVEAKLRALGIDPPRA